jgi:formylglycine-generating enzyme required for sulfatase activity
MLTRILAPILFALLAVASACDQQSDPVVVAPALNMALSGYDIVAAEPDPAVVTDAAARARMTATKLPWKVRDRRTGIVMLLCPPGEFMMGSPTSEEGRTETLGSLREAQHSFTITKAFYLSETEVTQEVWQKVMGTNPSEFNGANNPVEQVSWNDCQTFCQSSGLRLASESEWEYACRAGTMTAYSFGADITMEQANFLSEKGTVACGSLPANRWGFREMHGNVCEWCEDGYETRLSVTQEANPVQDAVKWNAPYRVLRGGAWTQLTYFLRSACRDLTTPDRKNGFTGFRVARDPL